MSMLRGVSALALVAAVGGASFGQTFDFEEFGASGFAAGDRTSLTSTRGGLTMTLARSSGAGFSVCDLTPFGHPAGWQSRSLSGFLPNNGFVADAFVANFSEGLSAASIQFGDYGADDDSPITLRGWTGANGTGQMVAVSVEGWGDGVGIGGGAFGTVTITSEIAFQSITFSSAGEFGQTLFWDNLTVRAVPAPAGVATLGLMGLIAGRRRRA